MDADLLAHLCQLLGDVHRDRAAAAYAKASIALAYEAGSESAAAFSAQAQIARWRGHFSEAADLAERGARSGAPAPLRMLLAYQEASSAAAAGDARRARTVLDAADAMDNSSLSYAAWSCPPARRALFRMGVAVSLGEPDAALRQAAEAEPIWVHERARAFGTWAHFRITAATAHIMLASPEGAIQEVEPVLNSHTSTGSRQLWSIWPCWTNCCSNNPSDALPKYGRCAKKSASLIATRRYRMHWRKHESFANADG